MWYYAHCSVAGVDHIASYPIDLTYSSILFWNVTHYQATNLYDKAWYEVCMWMTSVL